MTRMRAYAKILLESVMLDPQKSSFTKTKTILEARMAGLISKDECRTLLDWPLFPRLRVIQGGKAS